MQALKNGSIALISVVAFLSIGATPSASAQAIDPVRFIVSPETPGPNQEVRIEAQGIGAFLGDATITWRKDGQVELSGPGERVLTFTTGSVGSRTTITIGINSPTHGQINREFVFAPSVVNLVWEADTYVPPFFKGKALYTAGSPLKVVAYPTVVINGSQVANGSLSFQWSRNGSAVPSASGLGRNAFSFLGDQLQVAEQVAVEIFLGSTRLGSGQITIPTFEPLVVFYNRDPLRGVVYEQAFPQSIALAGKEITVQAEPYYFSTASKSGGQLSYGWELNGQQTTGPDAGQGILTLRQEGSGSGASTLGVSVQNNNPDNLIQRASNVVQIIFGNEMAFNSAFPGLGAAVATFKRLSQSNSMDCPSGQSPSYSDEKGWFCVTSSDGTAPRQIEVNPSYIPLEPLPSSGNSDQSNQFTQYLTTVFRLLIIGGALVAVLMLTIGGVTYMVSEVPGVKLDALDRAKAALLGILIIGASWLILNTINPDLLKFKLLFERTRGVQNTLSVWQQGSVKFEQRSYNPADAEGQAIRAAADCGVVCPIGTNYIVFNNTSDPGIEAFKNQCESGGLWSFISSYGGSWKVQKISGNVVNAPGATAHICKAI